MTVAVMLSSAAGGFSAGGVPAGGSGACKFSLPKVSGVELIKKLRLEDNALPVILISGAIPTEELNRHSWLQLSATLLKPFTGDQLLRIVKRVLRETQSAREQIEPLPNYRGEPSFHGLLA